MIVSARCEHNFHYDVTITHSNNTSTDCRETMVILIYKTSSSISGIIIICRLVHLSC